ncbi:MAG: hypothetical protein L0I92_08775, partial [Staphylococcus equorum]|nr:hypothetical protein [Staphylococcus equorum]
KCINIMLYFSVNLKNLIKAVYSTYKHMYNMNHQQTKIKYGFDEAHQSLVNIRRTCLLAANFERVRCRNSYNSSL